MKRFIASLIDSLKARFRQWLGVESSDSLLAQTRAELATVAEQNAKLADALRTAVGQLNYNTTTIARWAQESATLNQIERTHLKRAQAGSNGKGNLLILPPGAQSDGLAG